MGCDVMEMRVERWTQAAGTEGGREGEKERGRELDGVDLHSIQKHVQHLAHMAPLNVARLRSVCVFVSILIVLTGVCV